MSINGVQDDRGQAVRSGRLESIEATSPTHLILISRLVDRGERNQACPDAVRRVDRPAQVLVPKLAEIDDQDVWTDADDRLGGERLAAHGQGWRATEVGDELSADGLVLADHQRPDASDRRVSAILPTRLTRC
jgi:hypothetical protein